MLRVSRLSLATTIGLCVAAVLRVAAAQEVPPSGQPNVLFVAVDDLRPALGCYGDTVAKTPHIDALAERGIMFRRAYCQQAVCSPSRLSLLTGRRPDTTRVWDLKTHFRAAIPDVVTLPQHFKNHGYHTQSIGKIYHGSGKPSKDPPSWSVAPKYDYVRDPNVRYARPENLQGKALKRAATESADVPDTTYIDGIVCESALRALEEWNESDQPFFLAVGFRKPHLPFCAPRKYWDLYDRAKIPPAPSDAHPSGAPEFATRSWRELEGYTDIPDDGRISKVKQRELRHGYYACVSYVDSLFGRLIDKLEQLKLRSNTVIVLWGDHGFHLGEQGLWTKANNYELSTRVPLIISVPRHAGASQTDALVELVDLYPTLADVCGLGAPAGVEGVSLKPLMSDPDQPWKQAVFSQFPRAKDDHRHSGRGDLMGYAVRTHRYRYVQWHDGASNQIVATELYDHDSDPHEMTSVAATPRGSKVAKDLSRLLNSGWKAALPRPRRHESVESAGE